MENTDYTKNFSVELVVKEDPGETYTALDELKKLGYADNDSTIVFKNVRVPAGYCENFRDFMVTYGAIVTGDHALLFDQVGEDFTVRDAVHFLGVCSNSMKRCGREGFTNNEVRSFLEYRKSQNTSGSSTK